MKDRIWRWLAWRLPRPLAAWAFVRVGAHATTGRYSDTNVPELTMMDALAWAFVRVGAHATTGRYSDTNVPELTMMDALKRWDRA